MFYVYIWKFIYQSVLWLTYDACLCTKTSLVRQLKIWLIKDALMTYFES